MDIGNILQSYNHSYNMTTANHAATPARTATNSGTENQQQTDTVVISDQAKNRLASAKEIMSRYDLRNISHNSLVRMSRELLNNGVIDGNEYMNITKPSLDRDLPGNDQNDPRLGPDQPRDQIAYHENKVKLMQSRGIDEQSIRFSSSILSTFRNLAALQ